MERQGSTQSTEKTAKEAAPNPLDDRSPCEDCYLGEYKETGYRYCGNTKCPLMPGAGN